MSPTVVYRRSKLQRYRWNEEAKLEDYELYLQLAQDGEFACDPRVLSGWRLHGYNSSRDSLSMMEEILQAQARVLPRLGLKKEEVEKAHCMTRVHYVEDLVRQGYKKQALELFCRNFRGAISTYQFTRNATRLLLPNSLLRLHQRLLRAKMIERYGSLRPGESTMRLTSDGH